MIRARPDYALHVTIIDAMPPLRILIAAFSIIFFAYFSPAAMLILLMAGPSRHATLIFATPSPLFFFFHAIIFRCLPLFRHAAAAMPISLPMLFAIIFAMMPQPQRYFLPLFILMVRYCCCRHFRFRAMSRYTP